MKIIVASSGKGLNANVFPVFGRCPSFSLVEADGKKITGEKEVANPGYQAGGGAGIVAAQAVIDAGAQAVIAGNFGPNAGMVLSQAGISVYSVAGGTVKQAVESLIAGKLPPASQVPGHFGMQRGMGGGMRRGRFRGGRQ